MARSTTGRPEKKGQPKQVKKEKFEALCGWNNSDPIDNGFQGWIQRKLDSIESRKKSIYEWQPYLCTPKHRCCNVENLSQFEDQSLVPELRPKNYVPKSKEKEEKAEGAKSKVEDEAVFTDKDEGQKQSEKKEDEKPLENGNFISSSIEKCVPADPNKEQKVHTSSETRNAGIETKESEPEHKPKTECNANGFKDKKTSEKANTKLVKSVTSLGFSKSQNERPKHGLFNSVESISRLLRSNPVKLSYTRSNFALKQSEQGLQNTEDYNWPNPTNNHPSYSIEANDRSTNVVSQTINHNFHKPESSRVLHPNDYRTFGAFERSHTLANNNHLIRVKVALQDSNLSNHSSKVENKHPKSPKFNQQKPTPIILNKISLREASDSNPASHQTALASGVKDAITSRESETVYNHTESTVSHRSITPKVTSRLHSKGVDNLFAIGDIIPAVNKNINSSRTSLNSEHVDAIVRQTNGYRGEQFRVLGKDRLLPYEDEIMMVHEGMSLHQLKERNQNFLGPPAFRPQVNRSRVSDNRSRRVHSTLSAAQGETDSHAGNLTHGGRSQSVPTESSVRRSQTTGKLPPIIPNSSLTGHVGGAEVMSHTAQI